MPKKETAPVWSDDEINSFLGSRGHTVAPPGTPTQPGSVGAGEATGYPPSPGVLEQIRSFLGGSQITPGRAPTYAEMGWQEAAGQGAAREAVSLGRGAAKLAGQVLPTSVRNTLGQAIEQIPGVQRAEEFATGEPEGPAEYIGSGAMDTVLSALMPQLGLEALAARYAPLFRRGMQQVPTWVNPLGAGGRWMMGHMPTLAYAPRSYNAAQTAARATEAGIKGAAGGAIANPDDPAAGAEAGAGAALGGKAAGRALRSETAKQIGGWAARHAPTTALGALLGGHGGHEVLGGAAGMLFPHALGGVTRHYHTVPGSALNRFGRAMFDSSGRFLGWAAPTEGVIAGRATSDRPVITIPRRATPPPVEEPDAQSQAPAER
jgi:hypothetical protein